jgi:hypothetical protein
MVDKRIFLDKDRERVCVVEYCVRPWGGEIKTNLYNIAIWGNNNYMEKMSRKRIVDEGHILRGITRICLYCG